MRPFRNNQKRIRNRNIEKAAQKRAFPSKNQTQNKKFRGFFRDTTNMSNTTNLNK